MDDFVFINATAIVDGGGLTMLNNLIKHILSIKNNRRYYLFTSMDEKYFNGFNSEKITIVGHVKGKKLIQRIFWDNFGLIKWSKKNGVYAHKIITMQNTGCRYIKGTEQYVYIQNCLPFEKKYKWSLLKKDERKLWFYKNIFSIIQRLTIKPSYNLIVQSYYIKELVKKTYPKNKYFVIMPRIKVQKPRHALNFNDGFFHIIYPASSMKYKNHEVLINALYLMPDKYKEKVRLHFTISKDHEASKKIVRDIKKKGLSKNIILDGNLKYEELTSLYLSADLLAYPSYIETIGLPLIEGALYNLPVLAAKMPYAEEVIKDYEGAYFVPPFDVSKWCSSIINLMDMGAKRNNNYLFSMNLKYNNWEEIL